MVQSSIKRLEYIDAARGLAIFTVVYSHICLFCVPEYHSASALIDFLRIYFLNGFFFISGLLANNTVCSTSNVRSLLWKRTYQLLIPAVIVGLTYAYAHNISTLSFFFNEAKYGYWFTISLFEMYVIYYMYSLLFNRIISKKVSTVIFVLICFSLYFAFKSKPAPQTINGLLGWKDTMFYIPFFSIGLLFSQYKYLIHKIENKTPFLIFIGLCLSYYMPVPLLIQRIFVVVFVVWMIHELYARPSKSKLINGIKKFLLFVGNNSLEIYFLHYFILFSLPICIGEYLETVSASNQSLSMIEFIIVGTMSFFISIVSVLLSHILKYIPYVSLLAFGKHTPNLSKQKNICPKFQ